jgi:DNA-3-methyladenine glycosylase
MGDGHLTSPAGSFGPVLPRSFYARPVLEVARDLLGAVVTHGPVAVRLTEVEAYAGAHDPASHAFRGQTTRNAVMFGRAGHAYVYFTYGMHFCMNLVTGPAGHASAVLLRAGAVIAGLDDARARRPRATDRDLARGPARLTLALDVDRSCDGVDVTDGATRLQVRRGRPTGDADVRWGPRVGIRAAAELPWRAWIDGEPTVSAYRPHMARKTGRDATEKS